jgi:hypothetical protein
MQCAVGSVEATVNNSIRRAELTLEFKILIEREKLENASVWHPIHEAFSNAQGVTSGKRVWYLST